MASTTHSTNASTETRTDDASWVYKMCVCGHIALDHHGLDPKEGCLGVASHKRPQCECSYTCTEVGRRAGGRENKP